MIQIPYFDGAEVELVEPDDPGGDDATRSAAALSAFLSLTGADRIADSRHVHAYYEDVREWIGAEDWLDEEMGVPRTPSDIWQHVKAGSVALVPGRNGDQHCYVVVEAWCAWEQEHGLMMVWRDGRTLSKVGGYDGHVSNARARGDDDLSDVVYAALDRKYQTRLDE